MFRCNTVKSTVLGVSSQCRCDSKYATFVFEDKWNAFSSSGTLQPLSDIVEPLQIRKVQKGDLEQECFLVNISDQEPRNGILNLENISQVATINSDKNILTHCDLLVSKLGMPRGYIFLNPALDSELIGSSEFIPYKLKHSNLHFWTQYLLLSEKMRNAYACLETGKTPSHKRVNPEEFLKIRVPVVSNLKAVQKANSEIAYCVNAIKKLHTSRQSIGEIIDRVFQSEFHLDFETFKHLRSKKRYCISSSKISDNPDLRFSVKFHRESGAYVMDQLSKVANKRIKHFLAAPIILGASISPSDYSANGDYSYISMATIKNWAFEIENASTVSPEYAEAKQTKTVKKNDIIMARSGEGTIGKVAMITQDDIQGIFADFTMRIRLQNYNPEFAYYYFRTTFFQYLIEIYKKGLGNNTNIFPIVVQELPLIDISLDEQQRIVNSIHKEIEKQDKIESEIISLRRQIDNIITQTIQ